MTTPTYGPGIEINAPISADFATILTPEAMALVAKLHRAFDPRRQELLAARVVLAKRLDADRTRDAVRRPAPLLPASGWWRSQLKWGH